MKNIRIFYLNIFIFLVVKFSIYLNRRVFVMKLQNDITERENLQRQKLSKPSIVEETTGDSYR